MSKTTDEEMKALFEELYQAAVWGLIWLMRPFLWGFSRLFVANALEFPGWYEIAPFRCPPKILSRSALFTGRIPRWGQVRSESLGDSCGTRGTRRESATAITPEKSRVGIRKNA